jgi:predicted extracellular nuclease
MTHWTRWPKGLLIGGATTLVTVGCLSDDPNMDGVLTMTEGTSDPTVGDPTVDPTMGPGPGGTLDDTGTDTNATNTGPQPTGDPDDTTIYDVQMGAFSPGTVVTIANVVVVSPVQVNNGLVFVQEGNGGPYSGVLLYLYADVVAGVPLSPGDVVTITGEYNEFFNESQITISSVSDITVTGTGAIPAPVAVSPGDVVAGAASAESYEGVPVCLSNVTATDATNQFGDFHVDQNMAVTNLFLFGTPNFLQVLPGTTFAQLCGPVRYTFEEYKIAPRSAADYDATLVGCADAATPATIYEIQQGMFAPDQLVLVEDVVVTTPWSFNQQQFWVQEPGGGQYSGIQVYWPMAGGFVPTPGDVVTLCGAYDEYFDQSQIQISDPANVTAAGNGPVPAPAVLAPNVVGGGAMAEAWEGVLVRVEDVTVTTAANMFGEWQVNNALLLDDVFFTIMAWPTPAVGTNYASITGVMTYSFNNYKLAPRNAGDFVQ